MIPLILVLELLIEICFFGRNPYGFNFLGPENDRGRFSCCGSQVGKLLMVDVNGMRKENIKKTLN